MSHPIPADQTRVTVPMLGQWKAEGRRIVMTTAYDSATALIADPVVDVLLIGDSVGNVCLGFENTLPVTMAMMAHHLEAVVRARPRALVVADMPYLSFHLGREDTLRNAGELMRRGAAAVKLEGGARRVETIRALTESEIPVMGHLGLTPQSVNVMGGFRVQGKGDDALRLLDDALAIEAAGCFAMVLEGIPSELAAKMTEVLTIPTIGIGAGPDCSGQVLVFHDALGLLSGRKAKFVRTYVDGYALLQDGLSRYADDVRSGAFPAEAESYALPAAARASLDAWQAPARKRD